MLKKFFRKKPRPVQRTAPEDLKRWLFVRAESAEPLLSAITEYAAVTRAHLQMEAQAHGPIDGWMVLTFPPSVHPYYFHNLGSWVSGARAVCYSASSDAHWHYALVEEEPSSDYLVGVHEDGTTISLHRPAHHIVRGEALALPASSASGLLRAMNIPPSLLASSPLGLGDGTSLMLLLESYGDALNSGLATTHAKRPGTMHQY